MGGKVNTEVAWRGEGIRKAGRREHTKRYQEIGAAEKKEEKEGYGKDEMRKGHDQGKEWMRRTEVVKLEWW